MLLKRGDIINLQWNAIHGHYSCPCCTRWQDKIGWIDNTNELSELREDATSKAFITFPCGLTAIALKAEALNVHQIMKVTNPCRPNVFTMNEARFRKYVKKLLETA